jgi:hypothetical protein
MNIPSYNLGTVFTLRDKLSDNLIQHVGTAPTGPEFERFVDDVYKLLPEEIKYSTLYSSSIDLLNKEISDKLLYTYCWRIAGNLPLLRKDKTVLPWLCQKDKEWVPVQVLSAEKTKTIKGDIAYLYKLRILAGPPCPMIISKLWPLKTCSYIASKIGFSKPWKDHPFRDAHEIVSTRFSVELDPKFSRSEPGFEHIHCTASLLQWNKDLLKARAHTDPPCPYKFTHFCYKCPVGYDNCIAGVHPRTYTVTRCDNCNADTYHDPGLMQICIPCKNKYQ